MPYVSVFTEHFLNTPAENSGILRKLYLDFDLNMREIVELTDSRWSRTAVVEALKLHGISKANALSRTKYGEQVVKGEIVPHPRERKVIDLMLRLMDEGQTPYKISKYLNDKGIKGKLGGCWDKSTVRTVIQRERAKKASLAG